MARMHGFVVGGCVLVAAGAGCGSADEPYATTTTQAVRADRPFTVKSALPAVVVARGGEGSVAFAVARDDFRGAINLQLVGAPRGVRFSFNPDPFPPSSGAQSATLTVRADATAPIGTHTVRVRAQGRDVATLDVIVRALPLPTVTLDPGLRPVDPVAPDDADGSAPTRPVSRLADAHSANDFIEGELVVTTDDTAALGAFAARVGGRVVTQFSPRAAGITGASDVHLLRFDPTPVDPTDLVQNLAALSPDARGDLRLSSAAGLRTLAIAARAGRAGLSASLQMIAQPQTYEDRMTTEAPAGLGNLLPTAGYSQNPFDWTAYGLVGNQRTGVAESWRALELAGRLGNRVTVGVIDQGFSLEDLPPSTVGLGAGLNVRSVGICESNGTTFDCPAWHGTGASQIIAGIHDNGLGGAGVAGPVAKLAIFHGNRSLFALQQGLAAVVGAGARVVNISKIFWYPATITGQVSGFNAMTASARRAGIVIYASAGNDGRDVDSEDCFFACWEDTWVSPCENDGVECVGGAGRNDIRRHPSSAYGAKEVDIFAPWYNVGGPNPDRPGNVAAEIGGTSSSSPFMAGVAALVWAANPALSADEVVNTINATARSSDDANVRRFVQVLPAVRAALGPQAPLLQITRPTDFSTRPYGAVNIVLFEANVDDVEDRQDQLSIVWTSSVDGVLGTGRAVSYVFPTPGTRIITATVTDSSGMRTSRSVSFTATNEHPRVEITEPAGGARIYRGEEVVLRGRTSDANEGPGGLACDRLTWTLDRLPLWRGFGCTVVAPFDLLGPAVFTLRATDAYTLGGSSTVAVDFVTAPPNSPPSASIVAPAPREYLNPRVPYVLRATGSDPDGTPVTFQWTQIWEGVETNLGTGASLSWTPSTTVSALCREREVRLRLRVTDADGQVTERVITVNLAFGPC